MAKQTEAQKRANNKYRREKTKIIQLQYPTEKHHIIMAYATHINKPASTWIKQLIEEAINSDPTFTYSPEDKENQDDNSSL